MRNNLAYQTNQQIVIAGWEDTSLMPRNTNLPEPNINYNKVVRTNRKQFLERRRKYERQDNIENCEILCQQFKPESSFQKTHRTVKNDHLSSIHQLKRQMANIERIKDRWQDNYAESLFTTSQRQYTPNGVQSSLMRTNISGENLDVTRIFLKELQSGRKEKRPVSSVREGYKRSVTLSHRSNERSQTIHSRCSKRCLSKKQKGRKQKMNSSKLNITINQIEGNKMKSILEVLKSSI